MVWQAGRLETYQNTILGLFSAIMKKNGKSFGRLQALALVYNTVVRLCQLFGHNSQDELFSWTILFQTRCTTIDGQLLYNFVNKKTLYFTLL